MDDKSIICRTCYNYHHIILKGIEEDSTDAEIVHLLKEITNEMDTLTITGLDSIVEYSLLSSVNDVAHNLLKQRPMFLPQVYKNYCTTFHEAASSHTCSLVVAPESVVSTRYLLSYLVTQVGKHLQYTTKQRSAGTLLYMRSSDPLLVLTKVLHREHSGQAPNKTKDDTETNQASTTSTTTINMNSRAWEEMNTKIHNQIGRNLSSQQGVPFDIPVSTFDLDSWVQGHNEDASCVNQAKKRKKTSTVTTSMKTC